MSNNKYINRFIKRLVLVLILFAFFFSFNTNVKAEIVNIGDTENYGYTGDVQTFTAPYTGVYKLETWGAQGGSVDNTYTGGYGAYSTGVVKLKKDETVYIYVGGQGSYSNTSDPAGGYNGGGAGNGGLCPTGGDYRPGASGGGATHIATQSGLLSTLENNRDSILIVSGGGGASNNYGGVGNGGSAGGFKGNTATYTLNLGHTLELYATGGTQTSGGTGGNSYDSYLAELSGSFGQGGNNPLFDCNEGNGGGGGYYGGGASKFVPSAGGSGYIGSTRLTTTDQVTKHMSCYNCATSDDNSTKTISNTCHSNAATADCAKEGAGYAKVTFLGNNDTTLKTLTVSGYEIMPALRSDKRDYIVFVNENETSLTLNAETNDSKASILYNSTITIAGDTTTETLTVTAEDGTVGIYTLNIYKQIPSDMGGEYAYTGDVQTFTATKGGLYKLETWGAQGGNANSTYIGGYGGYSTGVVKLKKGETVYIYVGGEGTNCSGENCTAAGGYNGGGNSVGNEVCGSEQKLGSGGGATHIATSSGLLSTLENNKNSILIVSGGGGAGNYCNEWNYAAGGSGGGMNGVNSIDLGAPDWNSNGGPLATGGTQTSGFAFGRGGTYNLDTIGGGAGYYGGVNSALNGGGGGSGYIGSTRLTTTDQITKHMSCYNCATSDDESTKTISNTCHSSAATADCAKEGDGYARIMFIEEYTSDATLSFLSVTNYELDKKFNSNKYEYSLPIFEETVETIEINATPNDYNATVSGDGIINVPYGKSTHEIIVTAQDGTIGIYKIKLNREATPGDEYSYNYTGDVQEFIAPVTGKYKLETWGAQGGSADNTYTGGYGAYSTGTISLKANQKVYIYVGGEGKTTTNGYSENVAGGYNGGGSAHTSITSCSSATQYKSSGGGATHMATTSGLLNTLENNKSNILIVSAGGGGGSLLSDDSCYNQHSKSNGGSGAGYKSKVESFEEIDYQENYTCYPATQNSSGYCTYNSETKGPGSFGVGGSYVIGGGGGYYGGASGTDKKSQGGVSYIGNTKLIDKHMTCYNCETSSEESTKTSSTACFSISPKEDCAKRGNGYAKITPLGIESEDATLKSLTVTDQELKQAFDPERLEYDLILDEDATNVEINAIANDENASLIYNQNVELTSNPQLEQITVTAEDGTINVYSINIKCVKKSYLKKLFDIRFDLIADNQSDSITTLRKATTAEYNAAKDSFSDLNTISLANSPYPAYAWKDNDSILFYSEADIVYMNPDSRQSFMIFKNATSIDLSFFDTSKVTNMSYMFKDLSKLTSLDLSNFDTSNVANMSSMFQGCSSLTELDVSNFDTENVTDMSHMFENVKVETIDLSNFDTSKVTTMYGMFRYTIAQDGIDLSSFDTSNVTNMSYMFNSIHTNKLNLKNFDISKVTDMGGIFADSNVEEIDISNWKFNVTSIDSIFSYSKAKKIILDNVDTSSVTSMKSMFANLLNLTELDLSSLDTENVTDMSRMFFNCNAIESLDLSSFDTSKVTTMESMFDGTSYNSLKNINLSGWKVYNVTSMKKMFCNNRSLENIDLSSFDVSKVTDMSSMFYGCRSLKTIDLSNFYSPNLTTIDNMFADDDNLERIYVSEGFTTDNVKPSTVFYKNTKLIGGMGTVFDSNHNDSSYARIDDPENGNPGYLTYQEFKPRIYYPDGTFDEVTLNYLYTFRDDWPKDTDNIAAITFKYQNGEEDSVSYVTKNYQFLGWKVDDKYYYRTGTFKINVLANKYVEPFYNETIQAAVFPETPTSEHATFLGWYTEPTGGEEVTSYNGEEDITLYAHWDAEDMTISFEENGGEEISDIAIPYGSEIGELPSTTKTGFVLEGWYSDEELTNKVLSSTVVNDNMALYAKWIEDDFPIVYQDDEEVFDGTNYLNTHIKLYNEENISKDYEIGFTIEEFDESIQEQYATFVQDKYELESAGYPGLVVRLGSEDSVLKTNIGHKRNDDDRGNVYIDNYPVVKKVRIVRKDNIIYYSVNDGELSVLHNFNNFTNYFETEATFGAALDENNNPYRFLRGKLSNMYIRLGEAHDDHMVTYPDGNVEIYPHNTIITLGTNNSSKASEEGATVTFKYHNDMEDTTSKVIDKYLANGFKVSDTHYDNSSTLLVDSDKIIEYDYDKISSTTFPDKPSKEGFVFKGWFTSETDGEEVTSYTGEEPITLHAQYANEASYLIDGPTFISRTNKTQFENGNTFRRATKEEYNMVKDTLTSDNIFSTEDSPEPIYIFNYNNDVLVYTDALNIYLNPNSSHMFCDSTYFKDGPNFVNMDFTGFNTSKVTNFNHFICGAGNLTTLDVSNFDTHNVTDMSYMFNTLRNVKVLDVSNFDTHNVTNMSNMFNYMDGLESLDVSHFDTSNVTDMSSMFVSVAKVETLDVTNFSTESLKPNGLSGMFFGMKSLKSIDVRSFDTSNLTSLFNMFGRCESLEELDLSSFNTENITDMSGMFQECKKLRSINISSFDVANVTRMDSMFRSCESLEELDLSNFYTRKTANFSSMFENCKKIKELDISNFDTTSAYNMSYMFKGMENLTTIYVSDRWSTNSLNSYSEIFSGDEYLMGYLGTAYNPSKINKEYARVDGGTSSPGYLTDASHKGEQHDVIFKYRPKDKLERHNHNSILTLDENYNDFTYTYGTVTFKYHNGQDDTEMTKIKEATRNGFLVNDVHYDDYGKVRIDGDKEIDFDYNVTYIDGDFPADPVKENYIFAGWYTEEEGGEKVEEYNGSDPITLHAHWVENKFIVTTPDGEEEVIYGTEYELGTNDISKSDEELSTVTFKLHNEEDDIVRHVTKSYTANGWLVNGVHYDDEESFEVIEDVTIEPDYIETVIGVEFPDKPKKDNLAFTGWYDEETGGNKYTSYSEEEDIVLHAQYTDDIITINIPGEEPEIIPNGEDYILPSNAVEKDSEEVATVTFKLHNEEDDIIRNVIKEYTTNGWLINGVHYDDGDTITPTEDITLVPDYTESLVGVEFPNNPTKDEDVFIGWYDEETGGNKYTSYKEEEDIELHAQYDSNYAYLKEGTLIFEHVSKSLTGEFRKATEEEYNEVKDTLTSDNIISDDASRVPVYMWESNSNVYYYSEASIIFTNVNAKSMFESAQFSSIDLSGLNTSKTEDMSFMFNNCSQATSINVSNFDTSNVTTMYYMFTNSRRLTSLDISSFDTRNVNNMSYAFAFLERLSSLNVSNLNTSKVENMNSIFSGDSSLYELDLSTWDTSNVNDMSNMFNGCSRITSLNLYNLDISNVRTFYNMFNEMSNLESITMSNYYNRKVTNMYDMFQGCKKLQTVDISNINAKRVENISYAFSRTNKLTTIYATKNAWPVLENAQGDFVFATAPFLVGGQGTAYDSSKINKTYAIVDDPDNGNPGYFTDASTIRTQHDVTFHYYTGDVVEKHNHNTIMTLEENNSSKPVEVLGTITFKYHDDETDDSTLDIIKSYSNNGWLVNGVHYDDEGKVLIDEDKEVNYDYLSTSTGAELPTPTRDGYEFLGWYTEEAGGEKVESYEGTEDIVLHAHWSSTYPTDITIDSEDVTIVVGETHQIEVTFTPDGTEDTITYTGYEDTIISVSQDGLITALSKGTTTITVGTENTEISKTITVTVLSDKLESNVYSVLDKVRPKENEEDPDITDRIIIGAEPETLISDFKFNLDNPSEYIKIYDGDNELSDDDIVKTGLTIRLEVNGTIYDEAIIIIRGDINQDGLVNLMDKSVLSEQLLRLSDIEGYGVYAADIDNNDSINLMDKSKLSEYLLRLIDTLNE